MTTEEKAIRYDEALERAKEELSVSHINSDSERQLYRLFPELKESEDEKVRKHLISLVKNWDKDGIVSKYTSNPNDIERILAWLEKQGQEKSIDMSIKEKAHQIAWETSKHYDPLLSKESWCEMAALDMASWLEKQGEQKSAWSEEDSVRLQRIIDFLWKNRKGDTDGIYQQEQDIDWLKSLKQRYSWKPSDEQMEVLLSEVTGWKKGCPKQIVLESLYNDLKKLK